MTIKEIEELTGLSRSNIRFYEKEELINPKRNDSNGYREYSEKDVEDIKKIAYLRTLGLTVEQIRKAMRHEEDLIQLLKQQKLELERQQAELHNAQLMCEKMLESKQDVTYDNFKVEEYTKELKEYWKKNRKLLKLDTIGFFYLWGGFACWAFITILSILAAVISINFLPDQIPVQWNDGKPSTMVSSIFIFAFPVACILIRFVLRPFIWRWYQKNFGSTDGAGAYTVNSLCFIALATEFFIIYSAKRESAHIEIILIAVGLILIGIPVYMWLKPQNIRPSKVIKRSF